MNALMKALLKEAFDLEQTGAKALSKASLAVLLPLLIQDGEDVPAIIANWSDAKAELSALVSNPAADSDLVAYGISLGWSGDAKVQAVISACAQGALAVAQAVATIIAATKA